MYYVWIGNVYIYFFGVNIFIVYIFLINSLMRIIFNKLFLFNLCLKVIDFFFNVLNWLIL